MPYSQHNIPSVTIFFNANSQFPFRGYNDKKIKSNVECEIFQTIFEEAMESYSKDIVIPIRGDSEEEFEKNIAKVTEWYQSASM